MYPRHGADLPATAEIGRFRAVFVPQKQQPDAFLRKRDEEARAYAIPEQGDLSKEVFVIYGRMGFFILIPFSP